MGVGDASNFERAAACRKYRRMRPMHPRHSTLNDGSDAMILLTGRVEALEHLPGAGIQAGNALHGWLLKPHLQCLIITKPFRTAKTSHDAFANSLRWSTLIDTYHCAGSGDGATNIGHYNNLRVEDCTKQMSYWRS